MNDIVAKLNKLNDNELSLVINLIETLCANKTSACIITTGQTNKGHSEIAKDIQALSRSNRKADNTEHAIHHINKKTKIVRGEPIPIGPRQNLFDLLTDENGNPISTLHKEDTEIDKKLWEGRVATARNRDTDIVTVNCSICNHPCAISASLLHGEDGKMKYKCDECCANAASKRKNR